MSRPNLVAVVIAGGSGTRFWPLSTPDRPKQFLHLFGDQTMLEHTVDRLKGLVPPERILIVTGRRFTNTVRELLPAIPPANIIGEPQGRDTAAALVLAGLVCRQRWGDPVMAVLPADHVIEPTGALHEAVRSAAAAAGRDRLYTFGIRPDHPATGYGYLQAGEPVLEDGLVHRRVVRFREKPSREVAEEYLRTGGYFWNSGMFVWSTGAFLRAVERHLPEHARLLFPLERWVDEAEWDERLEDAFGRVPRISVDYGVMEKAAEVYMVEAPFRWSDVGGWPALAPFLTGDGKGNAVRGRVHSWNAEKNIVFCEDDAEVVALVGVEDLIVVRAGKRTLVARKDRAEDIKRLVESLQLRGSL